MKEVLLNGHKVSLYDSIESLPVSQFHKYSKYALVDSGIGDSIESIDTHISKAVQFLDVDIKKAHQEILNLRQCIYMVINELDLTNKSTLCLVYTVDGEKWTDFTDSGIDNLYKKLMGHSLKEFLEVKGEVVKKIDSELRLYFPDIFSTSDEKNTAELLRKRALLQLSEIIDGENHKEEIDELTKRLLTIQEPKVYEGPEGEEVKFDKQFENMCLAISKEFGGVVKDYSVMEFYSAYTRLENMAKEIKKRR